MKNVYFHDGDIFYRYDRGCAVRAKSLRFNSHKPRESDGYARWFVYAVGDPTVPSTQEVGVPDYDERTEASLSAPLLRGGTYLRAGLVSGQPPAAGWEVGARNLGNGTYQGLGTVRWIAAVGGALHVRFDAPADYNFPVGTRVYFYRPAVVASDNLFVPRRMRVVVEYDYPQGLAGPRAAPVEVHRRDTRRGKSSYYFADRVARLDAGEAGVLDAGYYAFVACHPLQDVEVKIDDVSYIHHYNEAAAPFHAILTGEAAASYHLRAGLTTRNERQPADRLAPCGETTLYKDGAPVRADDGRTLKTRGDIYLAPGAGDDCYVAWNDHGFDGDTRTYFGQCKLARVTGGVARKLFVDRWGPSWFAKPAYELEGGAAFHRGALYGGRRAAGRNWLKTRLRAVWAAPPQDNLPGNYDGGRAAVFMVPGDRLELLRPSGVLRLGDAPAGEARPREYVIAEAEAGVRYIGEHSPYALDDSWRDVTAVFTWAVILEVGREFADREQQVRAEVLGKYVTVARGFRERHELWRFKP
jgi:hypothetical protein